MRVLVVCGHALIGQSLITMVKNLSAEGAIEASCCDTTRALECAYAKNTDVILVEATTDFSCGLATVRAIVDQLPEARIVVLGTEGDEASIYEAISAGAAGYLTRETSTEALAETLCGVMHGELGLSRVAALCVVRQLRRAAQAHAYYKRAEVLNGLTQREAEVFDLVRRGLRSREIAERLCIAEGTVYKHIQSILEKLNVHSRTQAMLVAQIGMPTPQNPLM